MQFWHLPKCNDEHANPATENPQRMDEANWTQTDEPECRSQNNTSGPVAGRVRSCVGYQAHARTHWQVGRDISREATGEEKVRQASRSLRNSGTRTTCAHRTRMRDGRPFSVAALAHHGHTCRSAKGWDKSRQARHVATVTQNGSTGRPPPTAHECATGAPSWHLLTPRPTWTLQLRPETAREARGRHRGWIGSSCCTCPQDIPEHDGSETPQPEGTSPGSSCLPGTTCTREQDAEWTFGETMFAHYFPS